MRLADFIVHNREPIVGEWEAFARSLPCKGCTMTSAALRDHADEILSAIVFDMSSAQSEAEQIEKSQGRGERHRLGGAGQRHAVLRIECGYRLNELVAEYRALRASVLRLWQRGHGAGDLEGVIRFNEAVDEALTAATTRYMERMECYRGQFLGILGHDLRNPISAIAMGASTLARTPAMDPRTKAKVIACILGSARRMDRLVSDLLDLTRTRLGAGIPLHRSPVDLAPLCRQVVAELEEGHPGEPLRFDPEGDLHGDWDADRLAQVVSNLVGNAIQHGRKDAPVTVVARDLGDEVVLQVHNEGPPIPEGVVRTIFEPMIRLAPEQEGSTSNLGLGLFIAEQVVSAHGGKIGVESSAAAGTTFTVHLPRISSSDAGPPG